MEILMKTIKYLSFFLIIFAMLLIVVSCSDDEGDSVTQPGDGDDDNTLVVPDNNIPDIAVSDFPNSTNGGDPRGTYFANNPIFRHLTANEPLRDSIVESEAEQMMEINGETESSGTYRILDQSANIHHVLIFEDKESTFNVTMGHNYSPAKEETGTWEVKADTLIFTRDNGESYKLGFTSNSEGIFFKTYINPPLTYPYFQVVAYKRQ